VSGLITELLGKPCEWHEDEESIYQTQCRRWFQFTEGDPQDNDFVYCPFCGQPLVVWKYTNPAEGEEDDAEVVDG
jgi:uncharacterized protein YbaR (Trm112 family)